MQLQEGWYEWQFNDFRLCKCSANLDRATLLLKEEIPTVSNPERQLDHDHSTRAVVRLDF